MKTDRCSFGVLCLHMPLRTVIRIAYLGRSSFEQRGKEKS